MNLLKRIIVAIIFIPILLILYYLGGLALTVFLGILCVLSSYEISKMYERNGIMLPFFNIVLAFGLFYTIVVGELYFILITLFIIFLINGFKDVLLSKIEGFTNRLSGAMLCVIYPAVCFGMMYKLSEIDGFNGTLLPILTILIWLTDSFAYFIGMLFGKHRGVFLCSPKKSVEGFIAGFVTAFAGSLGIMFLFPDVYSFGHVVILTLAVGIFGQFGDLFESIIKRDMNVKDSSALLPGHGGVLDRFDSIMIAAPMVYLFLYSV